VKRVASRSLSGTLPMPVDLALPSRRRFVLGLAGSAAVIGVPVWSRAQNTSGQPAVLNGDRFDLTIGEQPFNVTGKARIATSVNGSVPAPILRLREGALVTLNVTNRLKELTSIHWHGFRLPADMDGVPGLSFRGIMPGETFTYRFPIVQGGTYWYHGHSGMQEQTGLYGAAIMVPKDQEPYAYDRDYVVMLSDWTDEDPMAVIANLKQQSSYYNFQQKTLPDYLAEAKEKGIKASWDDWAMWAKMRMSPTDILDVSGSTYTYLVNGQPPARNWTALFEPGEKVRLRFINGAAMSIFDVRIPGMKMTVVAADGSDVVPVTVSEFRIGVAETYDVIVEPQDQAYTIFAQVMDRTGYARGTLAPQPGMTAEVPPMDPRPLRTMVDMGMSMKGMAGMAGMANMPGMSHGPAVPEPNHPPAAVVLNADGVDPKTLKGSPGVDNVADEAKSRLDEPGEGEEGNGRTVLLYSDLKALKPDPATRPPDRELVFRLTGNMERWTWGFDGKKFSESAPIRLKLGERVRFTLVNDTMMEHPIHLHGFLFSVENGQDGALPIKHTILVKPAEKVGVVFDADTPGHWAFHCHLMFHMDMGMFRTVVIA
jgi:CopA family copper-resistance protein